jgi:hypothetical protein
MDLDLTPTDMKDITCGIKKRPPHVFKCPPKRTKDEKLIDHIVGEYGTIDIKSTARKFEKTTCEVLNIIKELGYY